MSRFYLSKSRFLAGIQCPKRLYLEVHCPNLAEKSREMGIKTAIGNQVGDAARQLFPGGALIAHDDDPYLALKETRHLLMQCPERPLFEATFEHEGLLIRSDIFSKAKKGFRLVEVKASTTIRDYYILDCAVQSWVIEGEGYPLERVELAYVNNDFIYQGHHHYEGLFLYEDYTEAVIPVMERIPGWLERFQSVLAGDMPEVEIGYQCSTPYACPFQGYCFPEPPEYPVSWLPRGGKVIVELLSEGIRDIRDIPEGRLTKGIHEKVRRVTINGEPDLDPKAGAYLQPLPYPRYFMDFETIGFAVPIWTGTRPYQQSPFQWSCHREERDGHLSHDEFLDISGNPPMRHFAQSLLKAVGDDGPVFVYNQKFEKGILEDLARILPDLRDGIHRLMGRIIDLLPIARKYYYHPQMKGSWSIKSVLPTIAPELDYNNLEEVQEGMALQLAYMEAIDQATTENRRSDLAKRMLAYCNMDTLALVKLVRFFSE